MKATDIKVGMKLRLVRQEVNCKPNYYDHNTKIGDIFLVNKGDSYDFDIINLKDNSNHYCIPVKGHGDFYSGFFEPVSKTLRGLIE